MRAAGSGAGPAVSTAVAHRRRRVLSVLCGTQIVSWGVLYYAFPVLAPDIAARAGWSTTAITGAFSAGLLVSAGVGIPVGRRLDVAGPRRIMAGGSVLGATALVLIALAPSQIAFTVGWLVAGVAMAGVLYPPAFTAIARWYGPDRVRALTVLTLAGGLASTVFAPLTAALQDHLTWRGVYLTLAAILLVVTVPAHWWGLRAPWPAPDAPPGRGSVGAAGTDSPGRVVGSPRFVAVVTALALAGFAAFAALINLVPLLLERGMDARSAALALGLGGAGQVVGRLAYPALSARVGVRARTVVILLAVALSITALGVFRSPPVLILAAVGAGVARGLFTLVHATAVSDRWGAAHYGRLTGVLSAPITVTVALAPWAGTVLADLLGTYAAAFYLMGVLSLIGALVAALLDRGPGQRVGITTASR
ncbi:MFS transporter [Pseudactinotalea sp. Z1748]|uniref:MFS transporter n=1 Tax=Pseudactinotalea sp. Z1748 TaxID=3413027 RepID=UPI003C79DA5A